MSNLADISYQKIEDSIMKVLISNEGSYFVNNKLYVVKCNCVVYTHNQCMKTWLKNTPKCLICRCGLSCYPNRMMILLYKSLVKSCIVVFLLVVYIIYISEAVKEEIRYDFDTTFCRYINNTTTVKSI